jgi:excisionase family DNA binding protein
MIDVHTLAHYLGVPVSTVYDWRTKRRGPVGYRFGKHVMFALSDVKVWIEQQRDPARAGSAPHGGERGRLSLGDQGFYNVFLALGAGAGIVMIAYANVQAQGIALDLRAAEHAAGIDRAHHLESETRTGCDDAGRRPAHRADLPGALTHALTANHNSHTVISDHMTPTLGAGACVSPVLGWRQSLRGKR